MSLPADLLEQAKMLTALDPRRPKQVNLRRAISAAYYAVFHLLTSDATALFVRDDLELATRFNRAIDHKDILKASRNFAAGKLPKILPRNDDILTLPRKLIQVAEAVAGLQEARHESDYNLSRRFSRNEAIGFVNTADSAYKAWAEVKQSDAARLYLSCFLLWNVWDKAPRGRSEDG